MMTMQNLRAANRGAFTAGLLAVCCGWSLAQGQGSALPAINYPYGTRPSVARVADATASYQYWDVQQITTSGAFGYRRVLWDDGSSTVSEGIGYGMLLAASYNDQKLFNDLWGYYNQCLDPNGLMNWEISGAGTVTGANAATDADEDVAFALLQADLRWGSAGSINYLAAAKVQIARIRATMVENGTFVLKPGDVWGGSDITNPSYFAPAYYRAFAQATGDASWLQVVDRCYAMLAANANAQTGIVSDWCDGQGNPNSRGVNYSYDACRTPWRIAMDYLFYGEPRALAFCQKLSTWAGGVGANNLVSGYTQAGAPTVNYLDNAFAGPFACGASAGGTSTFNNAMYMRNQQLQPVNYYNRSLQALTMALLNGLFPYPALTNLPSGGGTSGGGTTSGGTSGGGSTGGTSGGNTSSGGGTTGGTGGSAGGSTSSSPAVLTVQNDWGSGFTGQIVLTNTTGAAWNGWTVQFDLPYHPSQVWNGTLVSVNGNTVTVRSASWNAFVPSGGTATFGFNAAPGNVQVQPTNVYVNGVPLSGGGSSGSTGSSGGTTGGSGSSGNTTGGGTGTGGNTSTGGGNSTSGGNTTGSGGNTTTGGNTTGGGSGGNTTATGTVALSYQTVNDWGAGFVGQMVITNNTNKAIAGWTLAFDFTPSITNSWSAQIATHSGTRYTLKNLAYNGVLNPGDKVTFGFQGAPGGGKVPTNATINGTSVTVMKL
jgi:endo-1,4-beta-D-glucanase Y